KALEAAGADLAIDTTRQEFVAEIERRWGRDAVNVVLDPVGAASFAGDLRVLKTGGRIVILSTMSGSEVGLDLALLMKKRGRIGGGVHARRPPRTRSTSTPRPARTRSQASRRGPGHSCTSPIPTTAR